MNAQVNEAARPLYGIRRRHQPVVNEQGGNAK